MHWLSPSEATAASARVPSSKMCGGSSLSRARRCRMRSSREQNCGSDLSGLSAISMLPSRVKTRPAACLDCSVCSRPCSSSWSSLLSCCAIAVTSSIGPTGGHRQQGHRPPNL
eukprot:scaffold98574_cov60-Phaeocystis_antarctica.AAC.2